MNESNLDDGHWHRVPNHLTNGRHGIGAIGIAVYVTLSAHADNDTQQCWPSYATIAQEAECSRWAVIQAIKRLETAKLVHIEERCISGTNERTSNMYTLRPRW